MGKKVDRVSGSDAPCKVGWGFLISIAYQVGPRFCLNPVRVFSNSFGGVTLYENPSYLSPNVVRSIEKRAKAARYKTKVRAKQKRRSHIDEAHVEPDELNFVFRERLQS